jgi:phospholipid transport system transporter-binding protein
MFESGEDITHDTAKSVLAAGLKRIAEGATRLDCLSLVRFDSSALAVLLAWRRAAVARGTDLTVLHAPAALASLARAYGIDELALGDKCQSETHAGVVGAANPGVSHEHRSD